MLEYSLTKKESSQTTFNLAVSSLRIVFMGTPEFAVASLEALLKAGNNIVAVVTAPDKPAGRGMKLRQSEVKRLALEKGIPVLQPEKLRDPAFLEELKNLQADLQIVVAFRMLPQMVWDMPPKGTLNLHASLLPQYRGAAPINWAIINGEKETGVTTFKLQQEIDTGSILLREKISIGDDETAGELHDRMKLIGAELLVKTVKGLVEGTVHEIPQDSLVGSAVGGPPAEPGRAGQKSAVQKEELKHAPKIFTETCRIDWNKSTTEIHNLIRGLSPFPTAFTEFGDKTLKAFRSEKEMILPSSRKGRWESDKQSFLKFACADGYIHLKEVQIEGKKRMNIEEFLRGYRF